MRFNVRLSSPSVLVLVLVLVLASPLPAQPDWEEIYPASIPASGLTAFGDSIIAWCDGVIHVAGGDGRHWRPLASDARIGAVFAFDGRRLFLAAGNDGLFVRDRGDEDFRFHNADVTPVSGLLCVGDTLLMHTRTDLYRSLDGGSSFVRLHSASFRSLLFHDGTSLFALFDRDSLRRSDDGGVTWTVCKQPYYNNRYGRWSYVRHRDAIYGAGEELPGLRRSTDGGRNWVSLPGLPVDSFPRSTARGVVDIAASDEQLLINTGRGVFGSTDAGTSWTALSHPLPRLTRMFIAPTCILMNGAGGCFRYESSHRHWRQVEYARWTKYVLTLVGHGRYLAGDLYRFTPDEGESWWAQDRASWKVAARPDGSLLRTQFGYGMPDSSWLETSIDNGMNWVYLDSIPPGTHDVSATQSTILLGSPRYVGLGIIYTLRTSTDDGAHWRDRLTLPVSGTATRQHSANRRGHFLFFSWPHSVFSADEGEHWDTLRTPVQDSLLAAVLTENSLFLQSASGIWRREEDGSYRDTRLTERIPGARILGRWRGYLCIVGSDSLYFLHDTNGELRRAPLPELLVGHPAPPSFAASTSCVFLSPGAHTVFRLRLEGILDAPPLVPAPLDAAIHGVNPHPLRDGGIVRVKVYFAGTMEIELLDLLGRTQVLLFSGHIASGEHALPITLPSLPPGCYMLRLRSGSQTQFHPIIVGG
jgi:hypothetical protein